ncbi:MAG TPA: site-specific DNA-methyltransferase [Puia sp.]|nr:site-specific DNA-methyltransferase [Puia sp.]
MQWNKVYRIDAMAGVRGLPDDSVGTVVTSPPYFRQRDYGYQGQWGQEATPDEYVWHLVGLFVELRRVLKDDGTAWLVLGDSYASTVRGGQSGRRQYGQDYGLAPGLYPGIKKKDMMGVPWMVAFALRQQGWYLRQDVIWFKSNPMPESVKDRCTRCHEYIFMFSKNERYYYDHLAIATPILESTKLRMCQDIAMQKGSNRVWGKANGPMKASFTVGKQEGHGRRHDGYNERRAGLLVPLMVANRKSVWPIATAMTKEEHYASFPAAIPRLCIKAATKEGDVVLDPFAGTGTTLLEASILGRKYIGFDLSEKYVAIATRRLKKLEGIFYRE